MNKIKLLENRHDFFLKISKLLAYGKNVNQQLIQNYKLYEYLNIFNKFPN